MNSSLHGTKLFSKNNHFTGGKQWGKKYASSYGTMSTYLYNTKVERSGNQNFRGKWGQNRDEKNLLPLQLF